MSKGGDVCKALACGSDAVMVGSAFARAKEAPGKGNHWGMATPHANLPRGTRIKVGVTGSLKQILFGPATVDDGSQNLVGAITTCMGNVGASTHPSISRDGNHHRAEHQDRRQIVPNGAERRHGHALEAALKLAPREVLIEEERVSSQQTFRLGILGFGKRFQCHGYR